LLATDAPGLKDILEDGEKSGGILVSRDDTSAFTQALNQLLDDPSRCRALGYQAEQWVNSHYSLSAVGKQLHQFLFNTPAHD
jgi:starch synthase